MCLTKLSKRNIPKEALNLVVSQPRTSRFYASICFPRYIKLETLGALLSLPSYSTEYISSFLHIFMSIVENIPSYIKNTTHPLNILDYFRKRV